MEDTCFLQTIEYKQTNERKSRQEWHKAKEVERQPLYTHFLKSYHIEHTPKLHGTTWISLVYNLSFFKNDHLHQIHHLGGKDKKLVAKLEWQHTDGHTGD